MTHTGSGTEQPDQGDWVWVGEPIEIDIEPRQIDEPPLEQLHEDEWAWLLVYKYQEWLELNANFKPPFVRPAPRTPLEVRDAANWKSNFAFVKTMYDQGLPLSAWKGKMPHPALKYAYLDKRCSEAQRAYLQQVASGEIYPDFPDPADEAEAHRA